jgi:hypothetical protein
MRINDRHRYLYDYDHYYSKWSETDDGVDGSSGLGRTGTRRGQARGALRAEAAALAVPTSEIYHGFGRHALQ